MGMNFCKVIKAITNCPGEGIYTTISPSSRQRSKYILLLPLFRYFGARLNNGPVRWTFAMMRDVGIQAGRPFETINIFVDDFLTEEIEVKVILIVTKRLFYLFSGCNKAKINKSSDCDTRYCGPSKLVDKLERQEEKVYPDGMPDVSRIDERKWGSQDPLKCRQIILETG